MHSHGTSSYMVLIDEIQDEVSAHELLIQFDDLVDLAIRVDNCTVLTVLLIWGKGVLRFHLSALILYSWWNLSPCKLAGPVSRLKRTVPLLCQIHTLCFYLSVKSQYSTVVGENSHQ